MKQILLVLRKDCRKFWPEILLTLAITSAFVWLNPYEWPELNLPPSVGAFLDWRHFEMLAEFVEFLLPLSWLVLISRVVQDESLVGSRQFWVTRPYVWQLLMLEKLLFVGLFVCVPFAAAQVCLLWRAGLNPAHSLPGLGYSVLLIVIVVILPMLALAAVTSSLLRVIGVILVVVVLGVGLAFFSGTVPDKPGTSIPYSSDRLVLPMVVAFCVAVLIVQYMSRSPWLGRAMLVGLVAGFGLVLLDPFSAGMLPLIYDVPAEGHADPIQAHRSASLAETISVSSSNARFVYLAVPVDVSGIPDGEAVTPDDIRVSIDSSTGLHWTSSWQAIHNQKLTAGQPSSRYEVAIDRGFYDRVKSRPVTLSYSLALTEITPGSSNRVSFKPGKYLELDGIGVCSITDDESRFAEFNCRAAFHEPALAQFAGFESPQPCAADQAVQPGWRLRTRWIGSALSPALSDINFSPVRTLRVTLPYEWDRTAEDKELRLVLCPGSPLTVTPFRLVRRFQSQFQIGNIQLPDSIPTM